MTNKPITETRRGPKVTREQRAAVAAALIDAAGNLVEVWEERIRDGYGTDCEGIPGDLAAELIAGWLKDLPSRTWDTRLPRPKTGLHREW